MVLKCKILIYFIINKPCRKKIPPHNNYIHAYIVYYSAKVGLRSVFLMSEQFCNTVSVRQVSLLNAIWTTTRFILPVIRILDPDDAETVYERTFIYTSACNFHLLKSYLLTCACHVLENTMWRGGLNLSGWFGLLAK